MNFTNFHQPTFWITWSIVLILQNISFTFVSRARNSGSVQRHMVASMLSNGIWFLAQIFAVGTIVTLLTGKQGWLLGLFAGVFYTAFTMLGSYIGHKVSLATEKGQGRVGANKNMAQITQADWELVWRYVVGLKLSERVDNSDLNALLGKARQEPSTPTDRKPPATPVPTIGILHRKGGLTRA